MIGILLNGNKDLIIEGNGSLFMFHGKMTMFLFDNCKNIEIRNVSTDFVRPTISEMTVKSVNKSERFIDVQIHPDSWYVIEDKQLYWVGRGWKHQDGPAQELDPKQNILKRVENPISISKKAVELKASYVRLYFSEVPETKPGNVFQMRDGIRDQVGVFILNSKDISFKQVNIHYMHGLGIVGQFSENLYFDQINLSPRKETNRTAAAFADFIHMSGVKGTFKVSHSYFKGAHDDAINVHGTHLRIVEKRAANQLIVRFMHHETYGFIAFRPGDELEFLNVDSLITYEENRVKHATLINEREILITLEKEASNNVQIGDVIENITWTPEVEITNNYFSQIPTRGILMTTPKKAIIKDNIFEQTYMSGVLVACDARSWFESGRVRDLKIIGNKFLKCGLSGDPVIFIHPENRDLQTNIPVHQNILIKQNEFILAHNTLLYAKSAHHINLTSNQIEGSDNSINNNPLIYLSASKDIQIKDNDMNNVQRKLLIHSMSENDVKLSDHQEMQIISRKS